MKLWPWSRSRPLSRGRRQILWIVVAAGLLVATDLGARTFATNDEARFALLAQDVLSRGDWLHPRLNGQPYYNKPPLQAWLITVVSWPAGHVTQFTAVVPSALAAVAAALAVWGLGRNLFGTDAARAAALTLTTMQGVFLHARLPLPDMLLTAVVTAALWAYVRMLRGIGSRWTIFWRWTVFYGLVGVAFWAKGPVGFLPLGVALADSVRRASTDWWR